VVPAAIVAATLLLHLQPVKETFLRCGRLSYFYGPIRCRSRLCDVYSDRSSIFLPTVLTAGYASVKIRDPVLIFSASAR
jgi:hypothetical protein